MIYGYLPELTEIAKIILKTMLNKKSEKLFQVIIKARCGGIAAFGQLEKETRRILKEHISKTYINPDEIGTEYMLSNIIEKILKLIHSYHTGVYSYEKWVSLMAGFYISYFSDIKKRGICKNRINWQWGYRYTDNIMPGLREIGVPDLFDTVFVKEVKSSFYRIISALDKKYVKAVMLPFQNPPDIGF